MCEANVYLVDENGDKTLLLEAVDRIIPEGNNVFIENIFGERKTIAAKIMEMALVDHKIFLSKL